MAIYYSLEDSSGQTLETNHQLQLVLNNDCSGERRWSSANPCTDETYDEFMSWSDGLLGDNTQIRLANGLTVSRQSESIVKITAPDFVEVFVDRKNRKVCACTDHLQMTLTAGGGIQISGQNGDYILEISRDGSTKIIDTSDENGLRTMERPAHGKWEKRSVPDLNLATAEYTKFRLPTDLIEVAKEFTVNFARNSVSVTIDGTTWSIKSGERLSRTENDGEAVELTAADGTRTIYGTREDPFYEMAPGVAVNFGNGQMQAGIRIAAADGTLHYFKAGVETRKLSDENPTMLTYIPKRR